MKIFNKKAFTLAELLLTISIIGVLAALTIPTLATRTQDREHMTRFKAMYSRLTSALEQVSVDKVYQCYKIPETKAIRKKYFNNLDESTFYNSEGPLYGPAREECYKDNLDEDTGELIDRIGLIPDLVKAFGGARIIDFSEPGVSENITNYRNILNGKGIRVARIFMLKEGSFLMVQGRPRFTNIPSSDSNSFYIDTNGTKSPNMLGKDIFYMSFYLADARVKKIDDSNVHISPRKIEIYPDNLGDDADSQIVMFKRAIGAKL